MYCSNCGTYNENGASFCKHCGKQLITYNEKNNASGQKKSETIFDRVNKFVDKQEEHLDFKLSDLYIDVFKSHSFSEAENLFVSGTERTMTDLKSVKSDWPKPWLYSRVFIIMFAVTLMLQFGLNEMENANMVPGLMVIGSFTVPLSVVVFFMEVNVYRNISFMRVLLFFLVGGVASLVVTLFISSFTGGDFTLSGAFLISFAEETGKMIIVYLLIKKTRNCNYILTGMLIGASVGAGFAAFESAGYAFRVLFGIDATYESMIELIYLRGFLAPGGHVVWAAMSGAAIMIVKQNRPLRPSLLEDSRFVRIFAIPFVLHALWDWSEPNELLGSYIWPIILIIVAWIVTIALINRGLNEVVVVKTNTK